MSPKSYISLYSSYYTHMWNILSGDIDEVNLLIFSINLFEKLKSGEAQLCLTFANLFFLLHCHRHFDDLIFLN
jgi:hypothetical protein